MSLEVHRNSKCVETVSLSVRQHHGWQSVRFRGRRYQVFGGVRGPEFIDLDNPIKGAR